jgi:hypothetical protein
MRRRSSDLCEEPEKMNSFNIKYKKVYARKKKSSNKEIFKKLLKYIIGNNFNGFVHI